MPVWRKQRNRPKGAPLAFFGLALCAFALFPNEVGYQDIASLLASQPGVVESWQKRVFSAAASVQLATYSFSIPIGTSTPRLGRFRLASLEGGEAGLPGATARNPILRPVPHYRPSDFPKVNRALKGDRLVNFPIAANPSHPSSKSLAPAESGPKLEDPATSNASVAGEKTAAAPVIPVPATTAVAPEATRAAKIAAPPAATPVASAATQPAPLDPELQEAMNEPPLPQYDISMSLEARPLDDLRDSPDAIDVEPQPSQNDSFSIQTASLYFGTASLGGSAESIERWQPGEEPTIVTPDAPDLDLKSSPSAGKASESGESVAPKGDVNADDQHGKTPAERLGLTNAKSRAKAEKCLAEAVYFEARAEAVRGQIAVAQVVMNRTFSGYYPSTVCGVVFQSKYRHYGCQFTFACDRTPEVIREPDMWERAKKIAKAMLDGQIWLPEVGKSTHYHAYYVHPSWVSEMKRTYSLGVHTFYRPKAWGDGSDAPSWGTPQQTAALSAELVHEAKSEAEMYPNSVRR
jgi:spore germination cell wall hydrolase CwlJ-like protein